MDRLEELPLCSCRMEAPQVDSSSQPASRQCMATESIDGVVRLSSFSSASRICSSFPLLCPRYIL